MINSGDTQKACEVKLDRKLSKAINEILKLNKVRTSKNTTSEKILQLFSYKNGSFYISLNARILKYPNEFDEVKLFSDIAKTIRASNYDVLTAHDGSVYRVNYRLSAAYDHPNFDPLEDPVPWDTSYLDDEF